MVVAYWFVLVGYVLFAVFWIGMVWAVRELVRAVAQRESRALPAAVAKELEAIPERRPNQHLVDLELRNGRKVRKVRVDRGRFPALFGGRTITQRYDVGDVAHVRRHYGPRGAVMQVGAVALSGAIGFTLGAGRHITDQDSSLSGAVPSGLGLGTLFVVVHATLLLVDRASRT